MLVFLLFSCFVFSNSLTMEAYTPDNKRIHFFDHDNDNVKPLGESSPRVATITITSIDRGKIGLRILRWGKPFINYKLEINHNSIHCLPAYPSCKNLIDCLEEFYNTHEKKAAIIECLKIGQFLEKKLFFWQYPDFSKKNVIFVHYSLITNKINPNYIENTMTDIIKIYGVLMSCGIALGLASAEKFFIESNLLQAILFFIPAFLLLYGSKDIIQRIDAINIAFSQLMILFR